MKKIGNTNYRLQRELIIQGEGANQLGGEIAKRRKSQTPNMIYLHATTRSYPPDL